MLALTPVDRLSRELKGTAHLLDRAEGRALVDLYYQIQELRKGLDNQGRAISQQADDTSVEAQPPLIGFFAGQMSDIESQIVRAMDAWTDSIPVGVWAKSQHGIGPVLAAGLYAHIDITRAPTVGAIWRFAGLDPTVKWEKGQRRPWNARLKVLCWKIGDSFVKQSGSENCFYGHLYRERKAFEVARDERGDNATVAAETLTEKSWKGDTVTKAAYESGHLPAGRLDLRARRWAVKIFLAHWHEVAYQAHYGEPPPKPYPIAILGHGHEIRRPA